MRKYSVLLYFIISFVFLFYTNKALAIDNPTAVPNNKFGIHILFDSELEQAAQLVNASGGDWGYVTIPIQATDKNIVKWQSFMDRAKKLHVIPIIRLSTEGYYFNTSVWRKPTPVDIIDFANFLDSLDWPVKNRYVIIFNEVNRGDEWGGAANPQEYADLLSFASTVFKSKNPNYFIIGAGLDNAAPNQGTSYINEYTFMNQMNQFVPGIFNQIDGMASHAYPNPGFSQPPDTQSTEGISSYRYEKQLTQSLGHKNLPVFITETGWSGDSLSDDTRAKYYQTAFNTVWNDTDVVAVTPFLLESLAGPFNKFSFITDKGQTKQYQMFHDLPKVHGYPNLPKQIHVLSAETEKSTTKATTYDFSNYHATTRKFSLSLACEDVFRWLLHF